MTRAHADIGRSITDALHDSFDAFARRPDLGGDIAPLAHYLVDVATAAIPAQRIPRRGAPAAELDALVTSSLRVAVDSVATAIAPAGDLSKKVETRARLRRTVADWARDEISLSSVLALLDRGFDLALTALARHADTTTRFTAHVKLLMAVRASVTTLVVGVYAETTPEAASAIASNRQRFTAALLAGRVDIDRVRETGLMTADTYQLIALSVTPEGGPGSIDTRGRLGPAVAEVIGVDALALLSDVGGTIVAPVHSAGDVVGTETLAALTRLIGAEITATRVVGDAESIQRLAAQADELLDLVHSIGKPPGMYTMSDLVLEYQMTRPGPAHDRLAGLIVPLAASPELMQTLRVHLRGGMNRRETARRLSIHPNTVDNRMTRIAATLGLDLTSPRSIARMQSAILAYDTGGGRCLRERLASSA